MHRPALGRRSSLVDLCVLTPEPPCHLGGGARRPGCLAQRLRRQAEVAEDITEWRALLAEAEALACRSER